MFLSSSLTFVLCYESIIIHVDRELKKNFLAVNGEYGKRKMKNFI